MIGERTIDISLNFACVPILATEKSNKKAVRLLGLLLMFLWTPCALLGVLGLMIGLVIDIIETI